MQWNPTTKMAYDLFHEGSIVLAEIESAGIRIDVDYCKEQLTHLDRRIQRYKSRLAADPDLQPWRNEYEKKFSLDSTEQLGWMLYKHMGLPVTKYTDTGSPSTDKEVLSRIDVEWVQNIMHMSKLSTARDQLDGIAREVSTAGTLHGFYNLASVATYRSSSSDPNLQNKAARDEEQAALVRRAFLPDPGHHFGEHDYSGVEVRVGACFHKDPTMIEYIKDPSKDMHRDMACECYLLKPTQVTKKIRHAGKNRFVFPEFYGSFYVDVAQSLFFAIFDGKLATAEGVPLEEHLAQALAGSPYQPPSSERTRDEETESANCIEEAYRDLYKRFLTHMRGVEDRFWNERFKVYNAWKKEWYEQYLKNGYIKTLTGFTCRGEMRRNEVINYAVQGDAFHVNLWSLIRIHKELKRRGMSTRLLGQVHDSMLSSVKQDELLEYNALVRQISIEDVREAYPWLIVPLDVEFDVAPVGKPWFYKKTFHQGEMK